MDREKLEQMISETRERAVEVDRALKSAKRRKKAEEAKAEQTSTKGKGKSKSKTLPDPEEEYERIISEGKPLERAILYLRNFDMENVYSRGILTAGQKARLRETFNEESNRQVVAEVGRFYDGIFNYTRFYLLTAQKLWQAEANLLIIYCQKWEEADRLAETLTRTYYTQILPFVAKMEADGYTGESPYSEEAFKKYVSEVWSIDRKQGITPRVEQSGTDEEGRPLFKIVADVDGKKGLYSKILQTKESAENYLRLLRGAVEPFSDFMLSNIPLRTGGTLFPYTTILPHSTESMLDYPDGLISMREPALEKYFAYRLRQRREKGETITPEEEKRAVIPDYNQADDEEEYFFSARKNLYKYFPDYYDMNKDYANEK